MLEFLTTISDSIVSLFTFLGSTVLNMFELISMFGTTYSFLTASIALLPPFVVPFLTMTIVISVVFLIVGR